MSGKVAWYAMTEKQTDSDLAACNGLLDYSGNERELFNGDLSGLPRIAASSLNGFPAVYFASSNDKPLTFSPLSGTITARHFFVVAKYNGANFGSSYRGLISDQATNPVLLGNNSSGTTFFDLTPLSVTYYKAQTNYVQSAMSAPLNSYALVEISSASGWALDGIQIGQDRADSSRRWSGWVVEPLIFSSVLTDFERKRVNLYYDLKYSLWKTNGAVNYEIEFPSPWMLPELGYYHYREIPVNWDSVTIKHEYEDSGASFADTTDTPPQYWEIEYTGLTSDEAQIFDAFNDAVRRKHTFTFTAKDGTEHSGVRIDSYERNHEGNKAWNNSVKFTLVKFY